MIGIIEYNCHQKRKRQTQNFENEPVMLPCLHYKSVVRLNHLCHKDRQTGLCINLCSCLLCFLSKPSRLRCPSDVLIPDLIHSCNSQYPMCLGGAGAAPVGLGGDCERPAASLRHRATDGSDGSARHRR